MCGNGAKHVRFNRLDVLEKKKRLSKWQTFRIWNLVTICRQIQTLSSSFHRWENWGIGILLSQRSQSKCQGHNLNWFSAPVIATLLPLGEIKKKEGVWLQRRGNVLLWDFRWSWATAANYQSLEFIGAFRGAGLQILETPALKLKPEMRASPRKRTRGKVNDKGGIWEGTGM